MTDEEARLRGLATELAFDPSDEVIASCLDARADLEMAVERFTGSTEPRESVGAMADDEYGALLDCYEEPRVEDSGPLEGLTLGVKDLLAVKDLRLTCGLADFSYVPSYDAVAVERLLADGVAIVGKTNTDAYAFGPTGESSELRSVVNPRFSDRVPGGSSSGSAAAVAAGTVDAALGTDAGGSLRIPAACCGVVGVKPTNRLVPRFGLIGLAPSLSAIGPMAPDVQTAARLLSTMAGRDPRDPSSSRVQVAGIAEAPMAEENLTIGVPDSFFGPTDPAIVNHVRTIVEAIDHRDNVTVREVTLNTGDIEAAFPFIMAGEVSWLLREHGVMRGIGTGYSEEWHDAISRIRERGLNDHLASRILPVAHLDAETDGRTYVAARREGIRFVQRLTHLFEGVDVLLTPALRTPPPELDTMDQLTGSDLWGNFGPFNVAEAPAVCVPAGTIEDLPVSVQVVGRPFEDDRALQAAAAVEQTVATLGQ